MATKTTSKPIHSGLVSRGPTVDKRELARLRVRITRQEAALELSRARRAELFASLRGAGVKTAEIAEIAGVAYQFVCRSAPNGH
jgi:hypothetical protein